MLSEEKKIANRIGRMRALLAQEGLGEVLEALSLAQTVMYDTVGGGHPLTGVVKHALQLGDYTRAIAVTKSVISLFEEGSLRSPRLAIAHELEGDLLDIAQAQLEASEKAHETNVKQIHRAVGAFLAGAAIEDALRRLCDAQDIEYDYQRGSLAKLQSALYQPSKQIEFISSSENKQLTAWGDTRNKADHGKFSEVTYTEVLAMVLGGRAFIDKHLP